MMIPMEFTHLGYDYLDKVNFYQKHSGVDLNFGRPYEDLGRPVRAIADGEIVFSKNTGSGWGKLVVIYHPEYKVWSRYAHFHNIVSLAGKTVKEGEVIGSCGNTGGDWAPHVHFDIIKKQLRSWTQYTSYWSIAKVREYYADPLKFINNIQERESQAPDIVKWHKDNKIIESWEDVPPEWKSTVAWAIYKMGKEVAEGRLTKDDFNL